MYKLSITGHKDSEGTDAVRAFEQEIAAKAREFVASLDGVTEAFGTFDTFDPVDFTAPAPTAG